MKPAFVIVHAQPSSSHRYSKIEDVNHSADGDTPSCDGRRAPLPVAGVEAFFVAAFALYEEFTV